jgi:hypothetical protein
MIMPLRFIQQEGVYNPERETIRFFAVDAHTSQKSVMCVVSLEALEDLTRSSNLSETDAVQAFSLHRKRIEAIAERKYDAGLFHPDGYVLVATGDLN